jgi:hypothetical protein
VESVVEVADIPKTKRKKTVIENAAVEVVTEDIPVKTDSKKSRSKRKPKDTTSDPEPAEAVLTEGQQPDDNAKPKAKPKTRTSKLKAQS